jgi:hypothetical protein
MIAVIKIINSIRNDSTTEIFAISNDSEIFYLLLLFISSLLSWPIYAYIWTFIFKSEITGSIFFAVLNGFAALIDLILVFLYYLIQYSASIKKTSTSNPSEQAITILRWILAGIFPSVTIKRGIYDLKLLKNENCITFSNQVLYSMILI